MQSPVVTLLRSRTAATHTQVEDRLALLDGTLTTARLRAVIARFAGFSPVVERAVDDWATADPRTAAALSWPRRRRGDVLRADLLALGLSAAELAALPRADPVFAGSAGAAEVLGWLYVSEGSTLGGAVIDRALRRTTGTGTGAAVPRVATFTPYAEGPGPMWRSYLAAVTDWVGDDPARADAVARSAQRCFGALADWLEPLGAEAAA